MANNTTDLTREINRMLAQYSESVVENVDAVAKEVADEGADKLKARSPKRYGDYSKGWRVKKVKGKYVIHNKTNYQLTHLLEKGHAKVGGGRVPPKVHIAPVEEEQIAELERRIIEAVEQ